MRYLLFLCLFLTSCATSPTGRNQLMLVSPEQAIASSKQAYIQTLKPLVEEGKVDSDPTLVRRVQLITGRLISQAIDLFPNTRDWEWRIRIIDEPDTVNAWCMAGGKMALYTGLINKIRPTDDELAQVMGHEISHALANHSAEKMSVAMASQVGLLGLALAVDSDYSRTVFTTGAIAASLAISLPNSRAAEIEADTMGIELAARAGYNPRAAVTLWEKMEKAGGGGPLEFLSTHPSPGNRKQRLAELAEKVYPYYLQQHHPPVYHFSN